MTDMIFKIALATVGVTEVIKKFIQKDGKRLWTLITILVGVGMIFIVMYLPEIVLTGIVGISGAVVFYDTIFKSFKKWTQNIVTKGTKDE